MKKNKHFVVLTILCLLFLYSFVLLSCSRPKSEGQHLESNSWLDDAKAIPWSMAPILYEIPIYSSPGIRVSDGYLNDVYSQLYAFSYLLPPENIAELKDDDEYTLIANCAFMTNPIGSLENYPEIKEALIQVGLSPEIASGGIIKEHLEQTINHYFAGETQVDINKFLSGTTGKKTFVTYDPQYGLFFIQPSYFSRLIPCIIDMDEDTNRITAAFVRDVYGELYTLDDRKITNGISDGGDSYDRNLQEYLIEEAPKYEMLLNEKMQIVAVTRK